MLFFRGTIFHVRDLHHTAVGKQKNQEIEIADGKQYIATPICPFACGVRTRCVGN